MPADDAGDDTIDAAGHQQADSRKDRDLRGKGCLRDGAERNDDDFCGKNEVGADRTLDLFGLDGSQVDVGAGQRSGVHAGRRGLFRGILDRRPGAVLQPLVGQLLNPFQA